MRNSALVYSLGGGNLSRRIHLVTAAITLGMLVSMSVPMFVALKTIACFGITGSAVVITVSWALRIVRRENFVFAPS